MDLWQGTLQDFIRAAESGAIAGDMTRQFVNLHRTTPSISELRSWENSLGALAKVVRKSGLADVGVAISAGGRPRGEASGPTQGASIAAEPDGIGASVEYHLPLSGRRIDVLMLGHDQRGAANAAVIELKQWSSVGCRDDAELNLLVDGVEHVHPSQQALDYALFLQDYHNAFEQGGVTTVPLAYCHNMGDAAAELLHTKRFSSLLERSPVFIATQADDLAGHLAARVGAGGGQRLLERVAGGRFQPSARVLEVLEAVIRAEREWHLLDNQRLAYNAILAELHRLRTRRQQSAILIRGGPGTGKTVIAVQLLADALRLGLKAAHSTGGKAFTTTMRSKFKGAGDLFVWNMNLRSAPSQGLDLLLVDEAHRIRGTSDNRFTPKLQRNRRTQIEELLGASKVTVFLLDENQFVRPDEIGTTQLVTDTTERMKIPLRVYDLADQFRCGGCEEYVGWVDALLGFREAAPRPWGDRYRLDFVDTTQDLTNAMQAATRLGQRARLVAGFCWRWSDPNADGSLVPDVVIGDWSMPWNEKALDTKAYRPNTHPYTLWAETTAGERQVGCIYSAQGFEFDQVGVIWGPDLVWRGDRWLAQKECSFDRPVKASEQMPRLVRNAYRVLMTRGIRGTTVLCLDPETRAHLMKLARSTQ